MIGNARGWMLAAIVLGAEVAVVAYVLSLDRTTPPTAISAAAGALDAIALPVDPRTILEADRPGDSGALYRRATEAYLADRAIYDGFLRDRDRRQIGQLAGVEALVAATRIAGREVFAPTFARVVVYGDAPPVQAIRRVGQAAIESGLLVEKSDAARARAYYEAAFSLGARLFAERLTYREMNAGVELMSTSAACLAAHATKAGRVAEAAKIRRFTDAQRDYVRGRLMPTFEAIYTMNETRLALHHGDVLMFAADSRERVWRVEAILKLGRMRFNTGERGSPGDARHAARLATGLAESETDPIFRHAATLARDLTIEKFRTLR